MLKFLAEGSYKSVFLSIRKTVFLILQILPFGFKFGFCFRGYHDLYNVTGGFKVCGYDIKRTGLCLGNMHVTRRGLMYHDWTGRTDEKRKPKWLLDASCVPEYYARVAMIKGEVTNRKINK